MTTKTLYAIAILTNTYGRDEQVKIYREDDGRNSDEHDIYGSIEEAQDKIDDLNGYDYCLSNNESARPDYYIVEDIHAEYINSGRNSDGSNYDWDDCDCKRNDDDCCGECDDCIDNMIAEDRQYIINNSIGGAK